MLSINKFKKSGIKVSIYSPNHMTIRTSYGVAFQSYNSIVAFKDFNSLKIYLGINWDYSRATMKYLGQWLGATTKEIREGLKSGKYILDEDL